MSAQTSLEALLAQSLQPRQGFLGLPVYQDPAQAQALMQKIGQLDYLNQYPVQQQGAVSAGQGFGLFLRGVAGRYAAANPNGGFLSNFAASVAGQPPSAPPQQGGSQTPSAAPDDSDQTPSAAVGAAPQSGGSGQQQQSVPLPSGSPSGSPGMSGPASGPGQMPSNASLQRAQQIAAAVSQQTGDPMKAQQAALGYLAQVGYPGALEKLQALSEAQDKHNTAAAQAFKDAQQGAAAGDEVANRAFDQGTKTFKTIYTDPNGLYSLQQNAAGKVERVELKPPPPTAVQAAANVDPNTIKFMADTYRTTGAFPANVGRNIVLQGKILNQVAQDAAADGDMPGAIAARKAGLKANTDALTQQQKLESNTQGAIGTLDKNLQLLQSLSTQVDNTGIPFVNKALNAYRQGITGDPALAKYMPIISAVENEYARIQSQNFGNTPLSDSARNDAKKFINENMSNGQISALAPIMMQESQNRLAAIRDAKLGLVQTLSGNAPGVRAPAGIPAAAPPAAAPNAAQSAVRTYDPATGTFK